MTAPSLLATGSPACCADEEWEPVPDWPHEASTCGRVRSVDRIDASGRLRLGAILPQHPDKRKGKGYLYVTLRDGKRRRKAPVSVVVLEAHAGPRPGPDYEACHNGGIRTDNHRAKLRWDTREANVADMLRHRAERELMAVTDRPETSQIRGFPRWARSVTCHGASVTSARTHGTGSFPIPSSSSSHPIPLNPSPRTVRTILRALRNRQAA